MGVTTSADTLIDNAKSFLKEAQSALEEAIDDDTWGSKDFKSEFIDTVDDIISEIRKIRRKL